MAHLTSSDNTNQKIEMWSQKLWIVIIIKTMDYNYLSLFFIIYLTPEYRLLFFESAPGLLPHLR